MALAGLVQIPSILKHDLQAELQLPHRDSRTGVRYGAEGAGAGDRHTTRSRSISGEHHVRIAEDGVIRAIKAFESKLQILTFAEIEILQCREIPREISRTGHCVSAEVPIRAERLQRERFNIEPLAAGGLVQFGADTWNRAGTLVAGCDIRVCSVRTADNGKRETSRFTENGIQLPAANDMAGDAALKQSSTSAYR